MVEEKPTTNAQGIGENAAAPCGVCCQLCAFFHNPTGLSCGGCLEEGLCRGNEPTCWFVSCVRKHGVEHCGLCESFPCKELFENYQKCANETAQVAVFRIGDLALRARMGTADWLKAKLDGSLPEVEALTTRGGLETEGHERRRCRRQRGPWSVTLSFLPASQAFGLSGLCVPCRDASPFGLGLWVPASCQKGFWAATRTDRAIQARGDFPLSRGSCPFLGEVIWHNLNETEPGEDFRVGMRLVRVGQAPAHHLRTDSSRDQHSSARASAR